MKKKKELIEQCDPIAALEQWRRVQEVRWWRIDSPEQISVYPGNTWDVSLMGMNPEKCRTLSGAVRKALRAWEKGRKS